MMSDNITCSIGAIDVAMQALIIQQKGSDPKTWQALADALDQLSDTRSDLTAALHAAEEREGDAPTERVCRDMRMTWSNLDGSRG